MAIDITAVGAAGTHSFAKVNVNTDEDFIYYRNTGGDVIPSVFVVGTTFVYEGGVGALTGLTDGQLLYVTTPNAKKLTFSSSSGGTAVNFTDTVAGSITFNTPVIYGNKLNIDSSTATNQAVKYSTNGDPIVGLTSGETYFLKNVSISDFAGSQALYAFTNHTFTVPTGVTGRTGPTLAQLRAHYTTGWDETYLTQGAFQGYQDWTVPVSGVYEFDVKGAAGYDGSGAGTKGNGAIVKGRVSLTKGEIITLVVGQVGSAPSTGTTNGGAGGGSFVVRKTGNEPLFIAGGGSAEPNTGVGKNGVLTTLGGPATNNAIAGGTAGNGGVSTGGYSAAGGGFYSSGVNATYRQGFTTITNAFGGGNFFNGLTMATNARGGGYGGFGGGGQSDGNVANQSGGAGGYSGGAGSRSTQINNSGGGGGSFITQAATNISTSTGQFEGVSTFNGSPITNLSAYNGGEGSIGVTLVQSFTTGNEVYPTALDAENGTNKIAIEAAGSSYHAFVPISLDVKNDAIHSSIPHTLTNGSAVTFTFNSTPPENLASNTVYYVDFIDTFSYKLSTTPSPAFTGIAFTTPSKRSGTDAIRRVVVNTSTDTLTINNHGFQVDQPVQYNCGEEGTPILPLQNNATYYVAEVLDANRIRLKTALNAPNYIDFTGAGTGTDHSFIFVTVNLLENTLYIPNHGLISGQEVKYQTNANTGIGGLTNNSTYFVSKVDDSIIKLATNADNLANSIVDLTTVGSGTQSLVINSINFADNSITAPNHGFIQGELVEYDSKGQTVINGLTTATPYYVIFINGNRIRLATTPENAAEGIAVDLVESPAGVGVHSLRSLSKTPDGIYTIDTVPSDKTFTVQAKGRVPEIVKNFNPRAALDLNLETFKIPSHGFVTGTKVTYDAGESGTSISGLTDLTDYYVVSVNRDYFRLATTADNAASGITLSIGDFGTGVNHLFTAAQINGNITGGGNVSVASGSVLVNGNGTSFSKILKVGDRFRLFPPNTTNPITFAAADVNTTNNRVTKAHTYVTGDTVVFAANGGVAPSPLVDGYYYFVRNISATEITLHGSYDDAIANTGVVDFNTQGTGTGFTLTKTIPVGPIIRKITAVGSDTQITVDRPYANAYSNVSYSYPTFVYVRPQGYSLHRPFDGGVEMSAGANTSLAQIVRQTRKYFRYQSGKGIQTSCGINFKPSIDLETMIKYSDTTIECKTRRPHGLVSGLFVVISQAENAAGADSTVYNGRFQVTTVDLTTFRITASSAITEARAYGFPQFFVESWQNGAIRSGMFDFQNGAFYEFDGQKLYAVRRSSTQQLAGTASCLQGSEIVFGNNTQFTAQLEVGDMIVMRGQSYRVVQIDSDTRLSIRPEYKGSSGVEKEFDPGNGTTGVVRLSTDVFQLIGHGFSDKLPVVYNSIDGEPIGGLINGRTYYVDLIDNNAFKLTASPDSETNVNLSTVGTTAVHSFTPAKSGIIITKTVDTRVPQEEFSIDPLDGTGPTGYNLDLSRIQMAYMDYSWYGAGKIRFGFKTAEGQVQYVHEFVHNNKLYESYFRSGNLPARYEVVTYDDPTYIPFLFHWGTSVIMDGRFDDDNAYLFTSTSQALQVNGTTEKSFASSAISATTNQITIPSHGFVSGDALQFEGIATSGLRGQNTQNPATSTAVAAYNSSANLQNAGVFYAYAATVNTLGLFPPTSGVGAATGVTVATTSQSTTTVTVNTAVAHSLTSGDIVRITGLTRVPNYIGAVTVTDTDTFTYTVAAGLSATVVDGADGAGRVYRQLDLTNAGNSQYTYFLYPNGSLNNTSGPNYQPLLSIRLSPSVSSGLTGKLGDRDVINRMQLRLKEVGISTTNLVDVKILLNARLNNLNFQGVENPSLTQVVEHTSADTVSGGVQIYNFRAAGGASSAEATTVVDVSSLFELSNSILGGDSIFPDGPDILTIAVSRLTGNSTLTSSKLSWSEAQA